VNAACACEEPDAVTVGVDHRGVARVTIGTGRRRNAIGLMGWLRLGTVANELSSEPGVRVIVVRGAANTFCSGYNIAEWYGMGLKDVNTSFAVMEAALAAVESIGVPTVAVVQGTATGAGLQLALACDLRVVATDARIGMPILALGISTPPSFAARLTRVLGRETACDLLYTGRLSSAGELGPWAFRRLVQPRDLDRATRDLLELILEKPDAGLRAARQAIDGSPAHPEEALPTDVSLLSAQAAHYRRS
jgi:enoyl-CoA hydratase/carnithine racemase